MLIWLFLFHESYENVYENYNLCKTVSTHICMQASNQDIWKQFFGLVVDDFWQDACLIV